MIRDFLTARKYLAPSEGETWNWSDGGRTLVWGHNRTVAFREELLVVLHRLQPHGLPPVGALMLLLLACRDSWPQTLAEELVPFRLYSATIDRRAALLRELDRIHELPRAVRTDAAVRAEMAAMVFETAPPVLGPDDAAAVVRALERGLPVEYFAPRRTFALQRDVFGDLNDLLIGLKRIDAETLALRCRTGLETLVEPAEVELPPALGARELLARLERDEELGGLARLARNLMAVVHLPRSVSDPDDLPVGGVSDITNRGRPDQLLLSELAHDDTTLMTRIALSEALYLRRENPPRTPPRRRALLIDAGIRLWGVPRVFATAVALSLAAVAEGKADVHAWRPCGSQVDPVELLTREGLVAHLAALEPEPHPGAALPAFMAAADSQDPADLVLITADDVMTDRDFLRELSEANIASLYVVAVTRDGAFRLYVRSARGSKVLREARFDLDTILATQSRPAPPIIDTSRDPSLPAILRIRPFPLRMPHVFDPKRAWPVRWNGGEHVLAMTKDRRLMLWDQRGWAARQLSDTVPPGPLQWYECQAEQGRVQAVVGTLGYHNLHLLTIDLEAAHSRWTQLNFDGPPSPPIAVGKPKGVAAHGGMLFVVFQQYVAVCERTDGTVCHWLPLPAATRWQTGRFLTANEGWLALAYEGGAPRIECVIDHSIPSCPPCSIIQLFHPPGGSGPVGLTDSGCLYFTGKEPPLRHVLPGVNQVSVLAVSPAGERIVVAAKGPDSAGPTMQVISLLDGTVRKVDPTRTAPPYFADPILQSQVKLHAVRRKFTAVTVAAYDSLVLIGRGGRGWSIRLASEALMLVRAFPSTTSFVQLGVVTGPQGVGYSLKAATFADGSRVVVDSRGLLHLQSSDPALPQTTLVLCNDSALAGWCSDGRLFGPKYFTGERANTAPASVFREVLQPFVRRLR